MNKYQLNRRQIENTKRITLLVFGDSIAYGTGATDRDTDNWVSLVSDHFNFIKVNEGKPGTMMALGGFGQSFAERYPTEIPEFDNQLLFIAYDTNDCGIVGTEDQVKKVKTVLLNGILHTINQGFPLSRIKVISQYYVPTAGWAKYSPPDVGSNAIYDQMATAENEVCTSFGIQCFNLKQTMIDAGGDDLIFDDLHSNNAGYQVIANKIIEDIYF